MPRRPVTDWLPTSVKEAAERGWDNVDIVLFSGDAYVDHPSFGAAVIGRLLMEVGGYKVAIVPQPNWQDDLRDFRKFGRPLAVVAAMTHTRLTVAMACVPIIPLWYMPKSCDPCSRMCR